MSDKTFIDKEIENKKFVDSDGWTQNLKSQSKFDKPKKDIKIYDERDDSKDNGNDKKLNTYWTVWIHRNNCNDWTLSGYQKIYTINSIGSFWRFFNNFQSFNKYDNQIFIMREEIAPIWEDVNNKFGGICSIKVDSIQRGYKTDISTEMMLLITMLVMNETFVVNGNAVINGIEFSLKNKSSFIKIWKRDYSENDKFVSDLPDPLFNQFKTEIAKMYRDDKIYSDRISIRYKQIKPEYEL